MQIIAIQTLRKRLSRSRFCRPAFLMIVAVLISTALLFQSHLARGQIHYVPSAEQYVLSGLLYFSLTVIYLIWIFTDLEHPDAKDVPFKRIMLTCSPLLLIAFICFPSTSDIYGYLHSGRMVLNGINPNLTPLGAFNSEFSPYL